VFLISTLVIVGIPNSQTVQITTKSNKAAVHGVRNGETATMAERLVEQYQPEENNYQRARLESCAEQSTNSTDTNARFPNVNAQQPGQARKNPKMIVSTPQLGPWLAKVESERE
jgi:hypothetical protein